MVDLAEGGGFKGYNGMVGPDGVTELDKEQERRQQKNNVPCSTVQSSTAVHAVQVHRRSAQSPIRRVRRNGRCGSGAGSVMWRNHVQFLPSSPFRSRFGTAASLRDGPLLPSVGSWQKPTWPSQSRKDLSANGMDWARRRQFRTVVGYQRRSPACSRYVSRIKRGLWRR